MFVLLLLLGITWTVGSNSMHAIFIHATELIPADRESIFTYNIHQGIAALSPIVRVQTIEDGVSVIMLKIVLRHNTKIY